MTTSPSFPSPRSIWSRLILLGVFSVAMGLLEAIWSVRLRP